jgi:hypothetical protein
MARRGGKAATRRSRQRRAQRPASGQDAQPQGAKPQVSPVDEGAEPGVDTTADIDSGDAFEKADAELRASTPRPGSVTAMGGRAPTVRARTGDFVSASGPSRLGERASAEYHYVLRDLRNIGVLLVVLAVLLGLAVVLVNVLDIGRA